MASGWTDAETRALISAWGETNVQRQLDSVKRNRNIYQKLEAALAEQGYSDKSWKQCRVKVKNLTQRYRKVSKIGCCSAIIIQRVSDQGQQQR